MKKINYISLCSGYSAECIAFKRLRSQFPGFDFECLKWSEIEPSAIKAHNALHPEYEDRNAGDLVSYDWQSWYDGIGCPHVDFMLASTPCQSVSNAGKNEGMKKGSDAESALIWATEKVISITQPDIVMFENVKGMVSKKNRPDFDEWCANMEFLGYVTQWQILNAKDYDEPQNRERVFLVCIRSGLPNAGRYNYPMKMPLATCAEDLMIPVEEVPDDAWIDPERVTNKVVRDILDQPNVYEELLWRYHVEEASRRLYGRSDFDFMIEHYDELAKYATETLGATNPD
ncbi:MAG: DNA (cytosine-5-)-methyltransferase [Bacteroides sp.]|nr:DNA (cytosine-5-)-methyltransferase [Bacteroides sp.]